MDTQLNALPTLLSSLGAFCVFELRVFQTFLDNLRPICSGHGYPTQRAANTSCPRSGRFWLLELRVSRTFLDQLRPQLLRPSTPSSARGIDGGPRRFTGQCGAVVRNDHRSSTRPAWPPAGVVSRAGGGQPSWGGTS